MRTGNFPFGGNSSLYPTFFIASQGKFVNGGFILPGTAPAKYEILLRHPHPLAIPHPP
jgi:hypothetical protein